MSPEGEVIDYCAIVTTDPNELIRPIYDRMSVMVSEDKEELWLDPGNIDKE